MIKKLAYFWMALTVVACSQKTMKNKTEENLKTIWVNSYKADCVGVTPQSCYLIKDTEDAEWTYFYDQIEGFEYAPGSIYKIAIYVEELDPNSVPADASSLKYVLKEVIEKQPDPRNQLVDIWALEMINGQTWENTNRKHPSIEISLAQNKMHGNDGCNNIFANIEKLTEKELKLGMIAGTRMACPDMKNPGEYNAALAKVRTYKREGLKLHLLDEAGNTILQYIEVD